MLTRLRLRNFKSWQDTGEIDFAPITCLFGANSSGKTSLIQALLLLKQTAASSDRNAILEFGDEQKDLVALGGFGSVVYGHRLSDPLVFELAYKAQRNLRLSDAATRAVLAEGRHLSFRADIRRSDGSENGAMRLRVQNMAHGLEGVAFGMRPASKAYEVFTTAESFDFVRPQGRPAHIPSPYKCYGFPDQVRTSYNNAGFLGDLEFAFETFCQSVQYLGPLRAFPGRTYRWSGSQPADMGRAGERAVEAILSARDRGETISPGYKKRKVHLERYVAQWLQRLGLISSFRVTSLGPENAQLYEVKVRKTPSSPEALLTDVGFGVSQVLPVIVLCFYAPPGSIIILEQPEIHLHPSVQAGLADVLIGAQKIRGVQVIVESHSEHFLRRLQRRVAEELVSERDVAVYFCRYDHDASKLERLEMDLLGNISNWPTEFFGDQFGELAETQRARIRRRKTA